MNDATPSNQMPRSGPLFLRIFALLLGSLIAVQVMNAIVVIITPPPSPVFISLDHVERVLRGGASDTLNRNIKNNPGIIQGRAPRAHRIRELLAARLALDPPAVRVSFLHGSGQRRNFGSRRVARDTASYDSIPNNVIVAMRQPNMQWVVVSPSGAGVAFWRQRMIAALLVALLVALPIAWWMSRRIAKPIAMFAMAAQRLGRNPGSPAIELSGPTEVAEAAFAFNEMQARLQRYIADRSLMLGSVAHDLRTPLMRIALHIEHSSLSVRSAVEREVADMQSMLTAVLLFIRDQEQPTRRQRLDLRAIAESVVNELSDEGHSVNLNDGPPLVIEGDGHALKTMVSNLTRNAVIHGEGTVDVVLGADASVVWMEINDRGMGIAEAMLESMFEPFVRGEGSRSRETGGIGLGLASARAVAQGHGGDVTLANRLGGGLTARVELLR